MEWITYYDFGLVIEFSLWRSKGPEDGVEEYDARLVLETEGFHPDFRMSIVFKNATHVLIRDLPEYFETEYVFLRGVEEEGKLVVQPDNMTPEEWSDFSEGMRYCYGENLTDPSANIYLLCADVEWEYIVAVSCE